MAQRAIRCRRVSGSGCRIEKNRNMGKGATRDPLPKGSGRGGRIEKNRNMGKGATRDPLPKGKRERVPY